MLITTSTEEWTLDYILERIDTRDHYDILALPRYTSAEDLEEGE